MICEQSVRDHYSSVTGLKYNVDAFVPGNANLGTLRTEIYANNAHGCGDMKNENASLAELG